MYIYSTYHSYVLSILCNVASVLGAGVWGLVILITAQGNILHQL